MADRVIQRNDTAARWQSINPILATGEIGIEIDGAKGYKIGDGKTRWNDLPYPANPTNVVQEVGSNENAVMSQKAVSEKLSELGSKVLNNNFVGVGSGYASVKIEGLIPNHTYRIFIREGWEDSTNNTSSVKFGVYSFDGENLQTLRNYNIGKIIPEYIDVIIPDNSVYVEVGGRALEGRKVWFNILDIELIRNLGMVSLIPALNNSEIEYPNINTESHVLDLGTDPTLCVGALSYDLRSIHSNNEGAYRNIKYYIESNPTGAVLIVFNIDTKELYPRAYNVGLETNEALVGCIRSSTGGPTGRIFKGASFPFQYTVDGYFVKEKELKEYSDLLFDELNKEVNGDADFINYSPNIVLSTKGEGYSLEGYGTTDFIQCTADDNIRLYDFSEIKGTICAFDSDKNFIKNAYWSAALNKTISSSQLKQYAPDCAYIKAPFEMSANEAVVYINDRIAWKKQDGKKPLAERIDELEDEIIELKESTNGSSYDMNDIILRNLDRVDVLCQLFKKHLWLIYTDCHISSGNSQSWVIYNRIQQWYNANKPEFVSDVLCLGDIVYDKYSDPCRLNDDEFGKATIRVLGNHDVYLDGIVGSPALTDVYNKYYNGYIDKWDVEQPFPNSTYFYKDYESGVRLIVLNIYYFDDSQYDWLVSTLEDARINGLSVVIAQHEDICTSSEKRPLNDKWAFSKIGYKGIHCRNFNNGVETDDYIRKRLAVDSFIGSGGKFICWISGHSHCDWCGYWEGENGKQVSIVFANTNLDTSGGINKLYGYAQDCFTYMGINVESSRIYLLRIGISVDKELHTNTYMCYDYNNHEVVEYK